MKKFLTYILFTLISVAIFATDIITCNDYERQFITCNGGLISYSQNPINDCEWVLTASPTNGYKFAYWLNIDGEKIFDRIINIEIDTERQNLLWQATFVRDNSFIHEWFSDSIIFRTDTTDLLSNSLSNGYVDTYVYDTLIDKEKRNLYRNDYGIWSKNINKLVENNTYAGERLHMVIYNSCNKPSAVIDTVIPVVINGSMYSNAINFHSDKPNTNVHVFNGSVLTLNSNITINGILDIHNGGKVVIPEGYTLTTNGIILRGNGLKKSWPQLIVNGTIINNNSNIIYYDYTIDSKEYYPLSLPATVLCEDLTNAVTGEIPSFLSYIYNTETRNTGVSAWEEYDDFAEGASYEVGKGYIIYAPGLKWRGQKELRQQTSIIRFPLEMDFSTYGEEEKFSPITTNEISEISAIHKNWNFIGNPYLGNFIVGNNTQDTSKISQGYYELVDGQYEIITEGSGALRYITYTEDGFRSYIQERIKGFTIKPFNSYFVQTSYGNTIIYNKDDRSYYAPKRLKNIKDNAEIETGIILKQDDTVSKTGILFGDFTDEYDINADLLKEFGSQQPMSVYSILKQEPMAFQALPLENASKQIYIGYRNANFNTMSFSFDDEQYNRNAIKEMWLTDLHNNKTVNLMLENYAFVPEKSQDDNRFLLSFVLNNSENIATNVENVEYQEKTSIYDMLGNKISTINRNGVYIIIGNNGFIKKEIK